jgi:hypothetical protein
MMNHREGKWIIEVAKDCVTSEIDALITDKFNEDGRYLIEDDVENDNDMNIPTHIVEKAREMVDDVVKAIG